MYTAFDSHCFTKCRRGHGTLIKKTGNPLKDLNLASVKSHCTATRLRQSRMPHRYGNAFPRRLLAFLPFRYFCQCFVDRNLMLRTNRFPPSRHSIHESIPAPRLFITSACRRKTAPAITVRPLSFTGLYWVGINVSGRAPHGGFIWLMVTIMVSPLPHCTLVVATTVIRHREVLFECTHKFGRIPHAAHK